MKKATSTSRRVGYHTAFAREAHILAQRVLQRVTLLVPWQKSRQCLQFVLVVIIFLTFMHYWWEEPISLKDVLDKATKNHQFY